MPQKQNAETREGQVKNLLTQKQHFNRLTTISEFKLSLLSIKKSRAPLPEEFSVLKYDLYNYGSNQKIMLYEII